MKKIDPIDEKEIDSIIRRYWRDDASLSNNLRLIASASIQYGQRLLISETWNRFHRS
jgi:hypothetical protein